MEMGFANAMRPQGVEGYDTAPYQARTNRVGQIADAYHRATGMPVAPPPEDKFNILGPVMGGGTPLTMPTPPEGTLGPIGPAAPAAAGSPYKEGELIRSKSDPRKTFRIINGVPVPVGGQASAAPLSGTPFADVADEEGAMPGEEEEPEEETEPA
jgi:hypothetical protein